MNVETKTILWEVGKGALTTGIGFGAGCLVGRIVEGPVLITGAIYAIAALAKFAFDHLTKYLAEKFDWNLSTVKFIEAAAAAVLAVATAVSLFAIGIFGPVGLGVSIGLGLLFAGIPLAMGLYAKFGGKDMLYTEAKKLANPETPPAKPQISKDEWDKLSPEEQKKHDLKMSLAEWAKLSPDDKDKYDIKLPSEEGKPQQTLAGWFKLPADEQDASDIGTKLEITAEGKPKISLAKWAKLSPDEQKDHDIPVVIPSEPPVAQPQPDLFYKFAV